MWPACRGSAYCEIAVPGRAGHTENGPADWREGGAVNAIEMARHLLDGVERLRGEWGGMHHPLLPDPQIVVSRLVADSGWSVTLPDRAEVTLAVLILPEQADPDGWTQGVRREVESSLLAWCATEPWLAEHPPSFAWHTEVNPSETPQDAPGVQALLARQRRARAAAHARRTGQLVRRRDVCARGGYTRRHVRATRHRSGAHRRRVRPGRRPRRLRQGLALAGRRLCG